jgi:cytoskeletal protein RodZ
MKHCPQCDSSFPDTDQYCEVDGTPLISDFSYRMAAPVFEREPANASEVTEEVRPLNYRPARESQAWKIFAVSAIVVVATATALFFLYQQTQSPNEVSSDESSNASATQQSLPLMSARPAPFAGVSPSPEASPSPSPSPSPSAQSDAARVVLSSSPVSTGVDEVLKSSVVIRLTSGTSVEADEVWETGEGIWYRHKGVVTLLERNQVASIVRTPPAPSPTATPVTSPGTLP